MSICFVVMPFGRKRDANGREIDFNAIHEDVIAPAIRDAGLTPYRADEDLRGGIIHLPMYEALLLCDFVVADLTTANPNVFYELGIRHAMKPYATVLTFGGSERLPFDLTPLRAIPYGLSADGKVDDPAKLRDGITGFLKKAIEDVRTKGKADYDSPLYQLIETYPQVPHDRAEVFRNAAKSDAIRIKLQQARKNVDQLRALEQTIDDMAEVEAAVLIDLLLAYRDRKAYDDMISLMQKLPAALTGTAVVREQYALALNRVGRRDDAEKVLNQVMAERGPNPETCGLLGRIHKDRWADAVNAGDDDLAAAHLDNAIDAYLKGFESDPRDTFPGINAVTLLAEKNGDPRFAEVLPVVRYAARRKIAQGNNGYWDYATLLEVSVHGEDDHEAARAFRKMLAPAPAPNDAETTANNLRIIRTGRARRQQSPLTWLDPIIERLEKIAAT